MAVVIIEPSSSGVALVEAAHRQGKSIHVLSADTGDRRVGADVRRLAASVVQVETNHFDAVRAAVHSIAGMDRIEALIPGFEYMVEASAAIAGELGLPGLTPDAAQRSRNKLKMRDALRLHGLAIPAYAAINAADDAEQAARQVGFPAVLKPIDACGSLMVRRVDSAEQLHAALRDAGSGVSDMGRRVDGRMLLEGYVTGREFSLEGFVGADGAHVVAITEKILGPEPYFVEMGHVVEANVAEPERKAMEAYVLEAVRAVGLTLGVFHAEVRLSPAGPVLMEIAARLGGDRIYRLVELAKGVSLPDVMVQTYCAEHVTSQSVQSSSRGVAGVRFLTLGDANRFSAIDGLDDVRAMPGCQEAALYYAPGDHVADASDFRCRIGHVLFTAPDRATLEDRLRHAIGKIRVRPLAA